MRCATPTPLRKTGEPVSAGWKHVLDQHFDRPLAKSRSIFSITPEKLREILQSRSVVSSSVHEIEDGIFKREVDVSTIIGNRALKYGGGETTRMTVFTDRAGNLITAFPI